MFTALSPREGTEIADGPRWVRLPVRAVACEKGNDHTEQQHRNDVQTGLEPVALEYRPPLNRDDEDRA
jgi:hypothetical protein